jgi:hypothetical protein
MEVLFTCADSTDEREGVKLVNINKKPSRDCAKPLSEKPVLLYVAGYLTDGFRYYSQLSARQL